MSDDLKERLIGILTPHYPAIRSTGELSLLRALTEVLTPGGQLDPRALADVLPWEPRDFRIPGTVTVGANVSDALRVRQGVRIVYIDAYARTAPAGASLTLALAVNGGETDERISIPGGRVAGAQAANLIIPDGSLLTLNAKSAAGAANVTVTIWTVPAPR